MSANVNFNSERKLVYYSPAERSDEEILSDLVDQKIQLSLKKQFGNEQATRIFNIFKGKEPSSIRWKKKRAHLRIPSSFLKEKPLYKDLFDPLHLSKGKQFYKVNYRFEERNGVMEVFQNFIPLTKETFFKEPWLEEYKETLRQKDGDLLTHKHAVDLHILHKQSELDREIAPSPAQPSLMCRIIEWIRSVAIKIFKKLKNCFKCFQSEKPIVIELKSQLTEDDNYLDFFN